MSLDKLRKQSPSAILRLVLTAFTVAFAIGAVCAPDRGEMLGGLMRIITKPSLLTKDYFFAEIGSVSGAMLNAALVGAVCNLLMYLPGVPFILLSTAVFGAAAYTDYLDGHIARRDNIVTDFGKFIDPVADKLLNLSAMIMLTMCGQLPHFVVIVILARELAVDGLRMVAVGQGRVIAAGMLGKIKTVSQMVVIIFLMLVGRFRRWMRCPSCSCPCRSSPGWAAHGSPSSPHGAAWTISSATSTASATPSDFRQAVPARDGLFFCYILPCNPPQTVL